MVGCARSDDSFKLRNERPLENKVIYFMIEPDRGEERSEEARLLPKELMLNWFDLANLTIKYLIEYANKHPDVDILFKGKGHVHSFDYLYHGVYFQPAFPTNLCDPIYVLCNVLTFCQLFANVRVGISVA